MRTSSRSNGQRNYVLSAQAAVTEAGRCLLCHDAPCNTGCGADTHPAQWIFRLRLGDIRGAVRILRESNILAATCAQVCPTCRLCVKGCARSGLDEPIRIHELQAFLADYERRTGMQVLAAPSPGDRSVAVIGAGPAGLSAAASLARKGYAVVVYEKMPQPGGVLRYGIPDHRLSPELLGHELELIRGLGVRFECNHPIKTSPQVEALLRSGHDAVVLCVGCDEPYRLGIPGADLPGVFAWDAFLSRSKDPTGRAELAGLVKGKRVVVVGGGSVAMDCAVTAKRLGAARVYAVSLEALEELPADAEEKTLAFQEGIRFKPNCRVTKIVARRNGRIGSVRGIEIRWKTPGRFVPDNAVDIRGTAWSLPADVLVEAIGARPSNDLKQMVAEFAPDAGGSPAREPGTLRTSHPRVFIGGDLAGAGQTVASCVLAGKKIAETIAEAFPLRTAAPHLPRSPSSLEIDFCGLHFRNPFCLSSSPVSNTAEMVARAFEAGWGGAVFKTVGLEEEYRIIDPTPRLNALHNGDRRFIGLQNIEMISERPFKQNLRDIAWLKQNFPDRRLMVSIMGYSDAGWRELAQGVADAGADLLELNFSCPQMAIEGAGHKIGQQYDLLERYTRIVKEAVSIPVMAKMTPNITDILPPSLAAKRGGADAISAINTLRAITEVGLDTLAPKPTIQGRGSISGYSGPAVKPIALRFVAELAQSRELSLPVSGIGGLETWQDAAMFLLMGAANLQVTTAIMRYGYRIIEPLCSGLADYLESRGLTSVGELVGRGLTQTVDPSAHHQTRHIVSKVDADKCIGCGLCHIVCRDGANQAMQFDGEQRQAHVEREQCVGCLLCQHVCPVWDCISTEETDAPVTGGMHKAALEFIS